MAKLVTVITCCVNREWLPAVKGDSQSSPGAYFVLGIAFASVLHKMESGVYRPIRTYCTSMMDISTETYDPLVQM